MVLPGGHSIPPQPLNSLYSASTPMDMCLVITATVVIMYILLFLFLLLFFMTIFIILFHLVLHVEARSLRFLLYPAITLATLYILLLNPLNLNLKQGS